MSINPYALASNMQHIQPTLGEYLNGTALTGKYVVVPADFQRGLEWDIDTFMQLQETLFPWISSENSKNIWYKAGALNRETNKNYESIDFSKEICYLQEISIQGKIQKDHRQDEPLSIQLIDGQQRTFCARSIVLWAMVELCRSSPESSISQSAHRCLFIHPDNPNMRPLMIMRFENKDKAFEELCSAFYLSTNEMFREESRGKALEKYNATYDKLTEEGNSVQLELYSRICNAMEEMVLNLIQNTTNSSRETWIEAILLRLLNGTNITLTVLHPDYDSATHFMHKNSTGKDLSESSQIKSLLIAHSENDEEKKRVKSVFDHISNEINKCTKTSDVQVCLNHIANLIGHAINIDDHAEAVRLSKGKTLQRLNSKKLKNRASFNVSQIILKIEQMCPLYLSTYIKEANKKIKKISTFNPDLTNAIEFYRSCGPKAALYAILYAYIHHGEREALRLTNALLATSIRIKINEDYKKQTKQVRTKRSSMNEVIGTVFNNIQKQNDPSSFNFVDAFLNELLKLNVYSLELEHEFVSSLENLEFNISDAIVPTLLRILVEDETGLYAQKPINLHVEHIIPRTPTKQVLEETKFSQSTTATSPNWISLTSRIGNFALLNSRTNCTIKNQPFSLKKITYLNKGHTPQIKNIGKMDSFTKESVDARSTEMAKELDQILKIMWAPFQN